MADPTAGKKNDSYQEWLSTNTAEAETPNKNRQEKKDPLRDLLLQGLEASSKNEESIHRLVFRGKSIAPTEKEMAKLESYNKAFITLQQTFRALNTRIVPRTDGPVESSEELLQAREAFKQDVKSIFTKTLKAQQEVSKELSKTSVTALEQKDPVAFEARLKNATDFVDRRVDEAILHAMASHHQEHSKQFGARVGQAKINETVKGDVVYRNGDRSYIKPDFSHWGERFEKLHKNHQPYICTDRGDTVNGMDPLSEKRVEGIVANETMPATDRKVLKQTTKKTIGDDPFARAPKISTSIGGDNTQKKTRGGVGG
ncbi:MAG: hypothetical protein V4568_01145 [Pseudomonadota bacterium]